MLNMFKSFNFHKNISSRKGLKHFREAEDIPREGVRMWNGLW